jgi:hypothetical protein
VPAALLDGELPAARLALEPDEASQAHLANAREYDAQPKDAAQVRQANGTAANRPTGGVTHSTRLKRPEHQIGLSSKAEPRLCDKASVQG